MAQTAYTRAAGVGPALPLSVQEVRSGLAPAIGQFVSLAAGTAALRVMLNVAA